MMTEDSLRLLGGLESENIPGNLNQDISFAVSSVKNKLEVADVTFASGKSGSKVSSTAQSGRNSSASRARWSLPSETSLNDGVSLAERYAKHRQARPSKTSEELELDTLKKQRAEKQLQK